MVLSREWSISNQGYRLSFQGEQESAQIRSVGGVAVRGDFRKGQPLADGGPVEWLEKVDGSAAEEHVLARRGDDILETFCESLWKEIMNGFCVIGNLQYLQNL